MTEYTPEAEALARVLWPHEQGDMHPGDFITAQRAIDAGWTPPPDPHEDIARELFAATFPHWPDDGTVGDPLATTAGEHILATVRRIPDDLARQVAEALRGES